MTFMLTSGVIVTNECHADLRAARAMGQPVMIKQIEPEPAYTLCHNCRDTSFLWFGFVITHQNGEHSGLWYDRTQNKWVRVNTRQYPCPACEGGMRHPNRHALEQRVMDEL